MILLKLLKYLIYATALFITFVGFYALTAYILSRITIEEVNAENKTISIYIKSNGIHTDIVVPVKNEIKNWSNDIKFSNTISKDSIYTYLGMGWGDKGFYLETPNWEDLKLSVAFKAVSGLSSTAIHATYYKTLKEDDNCKLIKINAAQYAKLVAYIQDSFRTDPNGNLQNIITTANYGKDDAFYEAKGKYSLIKTCNTWANEALKHCEQRCCLWTAFDTGILLKYSKN